MRVRRVIAGLIAVPLLGACTKWVVHPIPPVPAPVQSMRGPVRVTTSRRDTVSLVNVVIATDSLFGRSADAALLRYSFPLHDVMKIEEQKKSPVQTFLLLGVVVVFLTTM